MSDTVYVQYMRVVFNCVTCGALLSVDNMHEMGCTCPDCGAAYDLNGDISLTRYGEGRPPTQWVSRGWKPASER